MSLLHHRSQVKSRDTNDIALRISKHNLCRIIEQDSTQFLEKSAKSCHHTELSYMQNLFSNRHLTVYSRVKYKNIKKKLSAACALRVDTNIWYQISSPVVCCHQRVTHWYVSTNYVAIPLLAFCDSQCKIKNFLFLTKSVNPSFFHYSSFYAFHLVLMTK